MKVNSVMMSFSVPQLFTQAKLNDLVRDLSKEKAELLSSRLKEKHLLETGTCT